jgi:hypothetical protein
MRSLRAAHPHEATTVSRLDSFIRRLMAQRACIDHAAELIRDVPGPVIELGLGNGRTYDHMRETLRGREIYVFERLVAAHPGSVPSAPYLILGDARETLPQLWDRLPRLAALAHIDLGTGEVDANRRLAAEIAPLLAPLMRANAVIVSEPVLELPGWLALPLPPGVREGRYHLYRVG